MRKYTITAQFVIGDNEDVLDVADKWLKETTDNYESPSCMFEVVELINVRSVNDTTRKKMKNLPEHISQALNEGDGAYRP